MKIASYPYDSIDSRAEGLVNWSDMKPDEDFANCSSGNSFDTSFNLGSDLVGGFSFTPQDCSEYDIWWNPDIPGSYRLTYDQGAWVNEGNRSIAYTVAWRVDQGTPGSQHDFQEIAFQRSPTATVATTCKSYDQSLTCSP